MITKKRFVKTLPLLIATLLHLFETPDFIFIMLFIIFILLCFLLKEEKIEVKGLNKK